MIENIQIFYSKPTSHQQGFTLSELLIGFVVLGLIAGLSIPSILVSVENTSTRSVIKEHFQTIADMTRTGVLSGDFSSMADWNLTTSTNPKGIVSYVSSKLSYTKQCFANDITSEGCKRGAPTQAANDVSNAHNARWVFANRSKLQARNASAWNGTYMTWTINTKAYANDMIDTGANLDTVIITCNVSDTTQVQNSVTLKSGSCGALDTTNYGPKLNTVLGN
jgi:prepilin-type N-terminal cleavage/methylation domain-containing protein